MRGRGFGVLAGITLTALFGGFSYQSGPAHGGTAAQAPTSTTNAELFVQTADRGILRRLRGHKHTYRLAFKGLGGRVTVFTDRPARRAGTETTAQFVKRWRSRGFVKTPPNAALVLAHGNHRRDVKVFELSRPRYSRRTGVLSFRARDLGDKSTTALSGFARRADRDVPARFRRASLFVDASASPAPFQSIRFGYRYSGTVSDTAVVSFDSQALEITEFSSTNVGSSVSSVGPGNQFEWGCMPTQSPGICTMSARVLLAPLQAAVTGTASVPAGGTLTATIGTKNFTIPSGPFSLK